MSALTDLPEPAQRYLQTLRHELGFDKKYADAICLEIGEHFYEAVECSDDTPDTAALKATQRFGSPSHLAAEFAVTLILRKLRSTLLLNLAIIVAIIGAVASCLTRSPGGPAILIAALCGCLTWTALIAIHRNQLEGARLYHWLCTPMIACQSTSVALIMALLWNIHRSPDSSVYYHAFEYVAVLVLSLRVLHLKLRSRSLCALWKRAR